MCQKAAETAANLMKSVEPDLTSLLSFLGLADTPQGKEALAAFADAQQALATWVPGTSGADVLEIINDFMTVFNSLPIPDTEKALADIIVAGVETIVGIISGNAPAPTVAQPAADAQKLHEMAVQESTTAQVKVLVPEFKLSRFHSAESQYNKVWKNRVQKLVALYPDKNYGSLIAA